MTRRHKVRCSCPSTASVVSLLSPIVSSLLSDRRRAVSSKFFDTQDLSVSTEELVLPRHARCVHSRFRSDGHSLLLNFCLFRIGRSENPLCGACSHQTQDTSYYPATDSLRRPLFGVSFSMYELWSKLWKVCRFHGLNRLSHAPQSIERSRVATTANPF